MQLSTIHVTNFRSVEDSTKFDVNQITCLVGKNEAGKTAVLQALAGLHPDPRTPITYELERDYPRRFLADYDARHEGKQAVVIATEWNISEAEYEPITDEFGPKALPQKSVKIFRRYGDTEPQWDLQVNVENAIQHLLNTHLNSAERKPLEGATNTKELIARLTEIQERSNKQSHLLERLKSYSGQRITHHIKTLLAPLLPRFLYFSHYDRMSGQVQIDNLKTARDNSQLSPDDQVFLEFLEYAGTSIEDIETSTTYEGLNAKCEAASNRITDKIFEYWTQNPDLEIDIRVTKAEPNDRPPFNAGIIARARVKNNLHKVTVPFSERSAGFIWFFSFLVKFTQVKKADGPLFLVLDEPGLTLHGKAQADLLRYFQTELAPHHQMLYSTHSPFMVQSDDLAAARIVEDVISVSQRGRRESIGTKVSVDVLSTDRDSIFPLQGALGYEVTQSLFIGENTLLVEGPSDFLYLKIASAVLKELGREGINMRWVICPAGGLDKVSSFVALFAGNNLHVAVLSDLAKGQKAKVESLRRSELLKAGRVYTIGDFIDKSEGDIEDLFEPEVFVEILNQAYELKGKRELTVKKLNEADLTTERLVKKAEAYFRVLPETIPEFDHYTPASWLMQHPEILRHDGTGVSETLKRFESIAITFNNLLGK